MDGFKEVSGKYIEKSGGVFFWAFLFAMIFMQAVQCLLSTIEFQSKTIYLISSIIKNVYLSGGFIALLLLLRAQLRGKRLKSIFFILAASQCVIAVASVLENLYLSSWSDTAFRIGEIGRALYYAIWAACLVIIAVRKNSGVLLRISTAVFSLGNLLIFLEILLRLILLPLIKTLPAVARLLMPVFQMTVVFPTFSSNYSLQFFYFLLACFFFAALCFSKQKSEAEGLAAPSPERLYVDSKGQGLFKNLLPFLVLVPVLAYISQYLELFSTVDVVTFNEKQGINTITTLINVFSTAMIVCGWVIFLVRIAAVNKDKLFRVCFYLLAGVQLLSCFYFFYSSLYGDLSRAVTGNNHILDSTIYLISACVHTLGWFVILFIFMFARKSTMKLRLASFVMISLIVLSLLQRPVFIPLLNMVQRDSGSSAFFIAKTAYTYIVAILGIASNVLFFAVVLFTKAKKCTDNDKIVY